MIRRQEVAGVNIGSVAVSRIRYLRYRPSPVLHGFEKKRPEVDSEPTVADDDIPTQKDFLYGPDTTEVRYLRRRILLGSKRFRDRRNGREVIWRMDLIGTDR